MKGNPAEARDEVAPRAVYGVVLNFRNELAALGGAVNEKPYAQPPRAPVLYLKPANTWIGEGDLIPLPSGEPLVQPGATLGIVFASAAVRVTEQRALDHVAGYCIVNDVRLPHESYYRPALKQLCRDGFCAIGSRIVERDRAGNVDALALRTYVNGSLQHEATTRDLVRSVPRLICDITAFMTLGPGDILMVGVPHGRPVAREGDCVRVEAEGIGHIENPVIAESRLRGAMA
jgi:5-oxopent-3-ene-1,2,5-tricarboxylate decarboxylase/2-hydroxyhepta-2,4-diene-1,7-dioate isomerase